MKRTLLNGKVILFRSFLIVLVVVINSFKTNAAINTLGFSTVSGVVLDDTLSTTQLIGTNINNVAGGISAISSIGFTFAFNGTNYTHFSVNENGLMRLATSVAGPAVSMGATTANQLTANADFPKIAAYFDDLKTQTGTVRYKTTGIAPNRKMMVQWNVTVGTTLNCKFQVWLFETTNNFQFVYGTMPTNTANYSVGAASGTTDFGSVTVNTTFANSTVNFVTSNDLNQSTIASGNSFLFKAPPSCPILSSPAASATNIQPDNVVLTWTAGTSGTTTLYDVYFGTAASPPLVSTNQAGTTYNTGAIISNTVYFWKIIGKNGTVVSTSCSTLQFTTAVAPSCPILSYPASSAVEIPVANMVLSWSAGSTGTTNGYDVYFGTAANPPIVSTNQAGTTYNAGNLNSGTTYYWKVVGRNGAALSSGCTVQQFSTVKLSYQITRSTGVSYNSIATSGNSVSSWRNGSNTDDNLSNAVSIGFNFTYSGNSYSSFLASTNGFITLNTATAATGNTDFPYGYLNSALSDGNASSVSTLIIAPFYEDIYCQGNPGSLSGLNGSVKYSSSGTTGSRVLTIEWIAMEGFNSAGPNLNFQVKLYEGTNIIEFVYGQMDAYDGTMNLNYNYSCGLSATTLSSTPLAGELINQLIADTRSFGATPSSQILQVPECYSMLQFVPGTYSAYVPPASLIPVNDEKINAISLLVNTSPCLSICGNSYSSLHATASSGFTACPAGIPDDDVWFKFIPTNSNTLIKVIGSGNYDPTIQLYSSSSNTALLCGNSSFQTGTSETLNPTNLSVGQTYYVRVYERNAFSGTNSSGQFDICISATPLPPSNDDCANSISLSVTQNPVFVNGTSSLGATASSGIPTCNATNSTTPDDDVWYKFVAVNATETITVTGSTGFNPAIQLFSGSCASLSSIECVNYWGNAQTETLTQTGLTINATYFVRIFHAGSGPGSGSYTVAVTSPPPACTSTMLPPNDDLFVSLTNTTFYWDPVPGATNYKILLGTTNPPVQQLTITSDTFAISGGSLQPLTDYYWTLQPGNGTGFNSSCSIFHFTTEPRPNFIVIRAFLQGLYNTTTHKMNRYLNPADTLTDSITFEMVNTLDTLTEVSINTFISENGYISSFIPLFTTGGEYYIVLKHRNHLETWSRPFVYGTDTVFDFTDTINEAYANNMKLLEANTYGIFCGDVNKDNFINALDVTTSGVDAASFQTGVLRSDVNFDKYVESIDLSIIENQVPLLLRRKCPLSP